LELDHRDLNKLNDAYSNLREATRSQNNANRNKLRTAAPLPKGVDFHRGKYDVHIRPPMAGNNILAATTRPNWPVQFTLPQPHSYMASSHAVMPMTFANGS
jgi:hypothetical protein